MELRRKFINNKQIINEAKLYIQELIEDKINNKNQDISKLHKDIDQNINWSTSDNAITLSISSSKGIIDNNIIKFIQKYTKNETEILEILGLTIEFIQYHAYECIWKERCDLVIEKEKN
ncbi:hypothetical protein C1645_823717 [Glomus cerebriforme]|uniref:Uncharacterized protein n=1 Tax=Glomus cerebriforme TaxID=658196 RepID=A0A397T1N7_9GLOM|nr:hypothetical protein C1645_823717 [Glomus cerebriforme]